MSFFHKKVDVSEGGKYDATIVSDSGLSQEELAALKKKQLKALDIFNTDGKAGLSKDELTEALSMYSKYAGEDGVLTKKELKEMAKEMGDDVSWKDLRRALKSMVGLMQNKNDLVAVNNAKIQLLRLRKILMLQKITHLNLILMNFLWILIQS